MTAFDYNVFFDPGGVNKEITTFVERVDWTVIGSGEINSAKIRLNAQFGSFITNADFTGTGNTPILDEFDRIRLFVSDRLGNVHNLVYEVDNLKPMQNAQQGTVLEVELLGLEQHLQRTQFAKQFFFESAFVVSRDITDFYNSSETKGTAQPIITENSNVNFNTLPEWTANDYLFNVAEQKCYDGLMNVIDRVGSSVPSGGAGNFWELNFTLDVGDLTFNSIVMRATISGNPPDQQDVNGDFDPGLAVTIDDTVAVNPGEEEGGIEATRGTVTATWGGDGFGTLPVQNSDFQGALEAWQLYPEHVPSVRYSTDAIIQDTSTQDAQDFFFHYQANKNTTNAPPTPPTASNADWDQLLFTDFLVDPVGASSLYSLWTNLRADEWKSSCANPNGPQNQTTPTFAGRACWDSNLVVVDGTVSRTWADFKTNNPVNVPAEYKRNGLLYRGFRILVDATGAGELTGFSNGTVVQVTGNDGVNNQWARHRFLNDQEQCAVDDEGVVYQLQLGTLVDVSNSIEQANDCYHNVWAIFNTQGINTHNNGGGSNFGITSAVTHEFRMSLSDANKGTLDEASYYKIFAGANFRIPFPHDSYNGNSIGVFYGNNDTKREPATLDSNNMHLTHSGLIGFNNSEAEDLGPIGALAFEIKMEWRYEIDGSGGLVPRGNIPYRCTMYDTSDNVVTQDFTVSFNNLWESVSLPMGSFKIYRARAGWSFGNLGQNVFLQDLEVLNVFEFKNIVKISIQWLGPYDDQGRFTPFMQKNDIFWQFSDFFNDPLGLFVTDYNIKLSVDNWRFTKPLLSVSPPDTVRSLQPEFFQEPLITNKFQNDQANLAMLEIMQFRHKQYEVTTEGTIDIDFGDSFFLQNSTLVNEADNGANTIQLVAKKIHYTIDKPPQGPGGFLRNITGVKRFGT